MAMFVNLRVEEFVAQNADVGGNLNVDGAAVVGDGLRVDKAAASGVKRLITDGSGDALLATGTAVPADAGAGYAKACLFIDTDVASGTTGLYVNVGTAASCVFKAVSNAA